MGFFGTIQGPRPPGIAAKEEERTAHARKWNHLHMQGAWDQSLDKEVKAKCQAIKLFLHFLIP